MLSSNNGDGEFDPGPEQKERRLVEMRRLISELCANTQFDKLVQWVEGMVVGLPDAVQEYEGTRVTGLPVRDGAEMQVIAKPVLLELNKRELPASTMRR